MASETTEETPRSGDPETLIGKALAALPIAVEVRAASGERVYANPAAAAPASQKRARETATRDGRAVVVESADFRYSAANYRVSAVFDVDDERRLQDELFQRAYFDPLTKLPTRAFFEEAVARSINGPDRDRGRFAVAIMGFDQFNSVNEYYGRKVGDALLAEAARRISERIGRDDVAARLGGDQFALFIVQPGDESATLGRVELLLGGFARPFSSTASRFCFPPPPASASTRRTTSPRWV